MVERLAVTPKQYRRVAYLTLAGLTVIVHTGAAVRLTGSGLGFSDWPKCGGSALPPISTHALIGFGNRSPHGSVESWPWPRRLRLASARLRFSNTEIRLSAPQ